MDGKNVGIIVVVVLVLIGAWFLLNRTPATGEPEEAETTITTKSVTTDEGTTSTSSVKVEPGN